MLKGPPQLLPSIFADVLKYLHKKNALGTILHLDLSSDGDGYIVGNHDGHGMHVDYYNNACGLVSGKISTQSTSMQNHLYIHTRSDKHHATSPLLLQGNGIVGAQGDNVASLLKHMTSLNVLKLAGEVRGVIWSGGGDIISNQ